MHQRQLTRPARVVRVIVCVVVATLCAAVMSSCSFSSQKTLYAQFKTAAGLFVGNDVGILGVPVGSVTAIKPEGPYVLVTMKIKSSQKVPAGAAAVIVSRSVATDRYVELTPVYTGGPTMAAGYTIPVDQTQTPVEFNEVLSTIGNFANAISGSGADKDAISRFLAATSTTLAGRGALINQAIKSLGLAVSGISAQRNNVTQALVSLDGLTSSLAANKQTIQEFIQQVSQATSLLAAERNNFKSAITSATQMITTVAQFAQANRAAITQAVNQTNGVMSTLVAESPQIAGILRDLPLATQNLQRSINSQNQLVVRLSITSLVPVLGGLLGNLCSQKPVSTVCTNLGLEDVTDPSKIVGVLTNLLNGGGL